MEMGHARSEEHFRSGLRGQYRGKRSGINKLLTVRKTQRDPQSRGRRESAGPREERSHKTIDSSGHKLKEMRQKVGDEVCPRGSDDGTR